MAQKTGITIFDGNCFCLYGGGRLFKSDSFLLFEFGGMGGGMGGGVGGMGGGVGGVGGMGGGVAGGSSCMGAVYQTAATGGVRKQKSHIRKQCHQTRQHR